MISPELSACSILLVDDEEANLDLLESLLDAEGYTRVSRVSDARQALTTFEAVAPDVVLLDLHMPYLTGYEVLNAIGERIPGEEYLPILVLTADVTSEARDRALSRGAHDFLTKPFDAVEVLLRVGNLLETRLLHLSQLRARRRAEAAEGRARLLAEASRVLAASLDCETGLAQVANLLVPDHAALARFYLRDEERYRLAAGAGAGFAHSGEGEEADPLAGALATAEVEPRVLEFGGLDLLAVPLVSPAGRLGILAVAPPAGAEGHPPATIEMIVDLAGRAAMAMENARLFAEAQAASRARERMLSVVAHDLRNPLAVVGMYAEMLLDLLAESADDYAAEALNSIYRSSRRMQEQIEGLLDVTRLQQDGLPIQPTECEIGALFDEAYLLLRPLAAARGIELTVEPWAGSAPRPICVDATRFQQLLSNLVGNAVKFTPEGGRVRIDWGVAEEFLRVSVADSGPGIAPDQLPHVFGAFWQAPQGDRRGLGLGLWIARAIVDAHGGQIWVDSAEGRGATFHFTLPAVVAIDADAPTADADPLGQLTHDPAPLTS